MLKTVWRIILIVFGLPVLIIHSEDDKLANPEKAKYWSKEIPGCTSIFFSGGGHLMTGNSEEINNVLDEFGLIIESY